MIYLDRIEGVNKRELFSEEPVKKDWSKFNPSVCLYRGELYYTLRKCNYTRDWYGMSKSWYEGETFLSDFILYKGDEKLFEMTHEEIGPCGIEDARLFVYDDELYVSCSKLEESNIDFAVYKVNLTKRILEFVFRESDFCEKNWMNIPGSFEFLRWPGHEKYSCGEYIKYDETNGLRGSTKLIQWNGKYLGVCHKSGTYYIPKINDFGLVYFHYFVLFDEEYKIIKKVPFRITKDIPVEFIPGLERVEDNILITYSLMDAESYEISLKKDTLSKLLN